MQRHFQHPCHHLERARQRAGRREDKGKVICRQSGIARYFFHQRRIACAAKSDVVRKNYRTQQIVLAVHRIDAVKDGNSQPGLERVSLALLIQLRPVGQMIAGFRIGTAAAKNRPERQFLDDRKIFDRA